MVDGNCLTANSGHDLLLIRHLVQEPLSSAFDPDRDHDGESGPRGSGDFERQQSLLGPFFMGTLSALVVYRSSKYLSGRRVRPSETPRSK